MVVSSNARFECGVAVDEELKRNRLQKEIERDCSGVLTQANGFPHLPWEHLALFSTIVVWNNF